MASQVAVWGDRCPHLNLCEGSLIQKRLDKAPHSSEHEGGIDNEHASEVLGEVVLKRRGVESTRRQGHDLSTGGACDALPEVGCFPWVRPHLSPDPPLLSAARMSWQSD